MEQADEMQRHANPDPYFRPQHGTRPGGGDREGDAALEPVTTGTGNHEQDGYRSRGERAPEGLQLRPPERRYNHQCQAATNARAAANATMATVRSIGW